MVKKKEKLSVREVEHIADLARIELGEEEKSKYAEDLSAVLGYIDQLSEADTSKVSGFVHAAEAVNMVREDMVENCDKETKEKIVSSAPIKENGYIKVKAVL